MLRKKTLMATSLIVAVGITSICIYVWTTPGLVIIFVDIDLYENIRSLVEQYQQDIIMQGFQVSVNPWSDLSVQNLRTNLQTQPWNFQGAILIGNLPYCMYKYEDEIFPIDLYLTDLNGEWADTDSDGIYDSHTGNVGPEIFLGRINPEPLKSVDSISAYTRYFYRNHEYRIQTSSGSERLLLFLDDDWGVASWQYEEQVKGFGNIDAFSENESTNVVNYLGNITSPGYNFVHLNVHSNATTHFFIPFSITNQLNSTDIWNAALKPTFYNLYSCSAANFNVIDNLATAYLFSNSTLAVVGSTKIGGMMAASSFYNQLGRGVPIGQAFKEWYNLNEYGPRYGSSIGMCILGDPLLTVIKGGT